MRFSTRPGNLRELHNALEHALITHVLSPHEKDKRERSVVKTMLTAIGVGMIGVFTLHHYGKVNANEMDAFIAAAKTRQWDREKNVRMLACAPASALLLLAAGSLFVEHEVATQTVFSLVNHYTPLTSEQERGGVETVRDWLQTGNKTSLLAIPMLLWGAIKFLRTSFFGAHPRSGVCFQECGAW